MRPSLILAAAVLASAAAHAQTAPQPQPRQAAPIEVIGKQGPEKKVCRTERAVGSRVVKRICKSAAEQQRDLRDAQAKLQMGSHGPNAPEAFKRPRGD